MNDDNYDFETMPGFDVPGDSRPDSEILYTFAEASRLTGSSLPRFYTERNLKRMGYMDKDGNKLPKPEGGYTISKAKLIEFGWLQSDGSPSTKVRNEEAREWISKMNELKEQNRLLLIRAELAEARLADKDREIERLTKALFNN